MAKCFYKNCGNTKRSKRGSNLRYHPFPKPSRKMAQCLIWLNNCGNDDLNLHNISKNVYVCENHFVEGSTNPVPYYFNMSEEHARKHISFEVGEYVEVGNDQAQPLSEYPHDDHSYSKPMPSTSYHDFAVENPKKPLKPDFEPGFFLYASQAKSKNFKFFTGLSVKAFEVLYSLLDEEVMPLLKYTYKVKTPIQKQKLMSLSDKDKLCLTLMRLRRGYSLKELSIFFQLSVSYVSVIFYTWVQFIYLQTCCFRNDLIQGSRQTDKHHMPAVFRTFNDRVTIILDATEIRMQMSRNFQRQGNTHSAYKHYNTVKFLVGISCRGAIIYNSEGFEGSISDPELFRRCDIETFLKEGDVIMADRGFTIQELCNEKGYKLLMPPFLAGRTKLTAEEEILTKKIAKCRIHVERAIQRIKTYQILSHPIRISMLPIISNIFNVICFLANFEKPLAN